LPANLWVSRVIASKFKKERVYATLNGYRFDDFTSYVYVSEDAGQTWKSIRNNIPTSPVNAIKEDSVNENILYLGTDNGLYVSFNKGDSWQAFANNLPNVAVHDLVLQPTAKELIIATHGRSLYKANVASLQKMTADILLKSTHIFPIDAIKKNNSWGRSWSQWRTAYTPEIKIPFYSNADAKITVGIYLGAVNVNSISIAANSGFNEAMFDASFSEKGKKMYEKANKKVELKAAKNGIFYLPKGKYVIKIGVAERAFEVK
jgi:ligand-binding sensor domain-containing protein